MGANTRSDGHNTCTICDNTPGDDTWKRDDCTASEHRIHNADNQ
jgi:hypothetical protein